jgi:hypothetical protein
MRSSAVQLTRVLSDSHHFVYREALIDAVLVNGDQDQIVESLKKRILLKANHCGQATGFFGLWTALAFALTPHPEIVSCFTIPLWIVTAGGALLDMNGLKTTLFAVEATKLKD